jgi:hypothetical protein
MAATPIQALRLMTPADLGIMLEADVEARVSTLAAGGRK